jgi:uracil-DNA glycosylase family 4
MSEFTKLQADSEVLQARRSLQGDPQASVMVIGEAYGAEESRLSAPFVGPSGRLLTELLVGTGLSAHSVYYTNLVNQRPPANDLRQWTTDAGLPSGPLLDGLVSLKQEIDRVNPSVIIPVGNYPLRFLTGKGKWDKSDGPSGIGNYRGSILAGTVLAGGRKCVPTYHPAAVLRQYPLKHIVRLDLSRSVEQSKFPEIRRPLQAIIIEPAGADRQAWGEWFTSCAGTPSPVFKWTEGWEHASAQEPHTSLSDPFLTVDIEYIRDRLLCVGFTRSNDVAVTVPIRTPADIEFVRGILLSGVPLCFQNGMFDSSILEWFHAIECVKYIKHDTMVMMHCAIQSSQRISDSSDQCSLRNLYGGIKLIGRMKAFGCRMTCTTTMQRMCESRT